MVVAGMAIGIKCPQGCEAGDQSCPDSFPAEYIYSYVGIKYILKVDNKEKNTCMFLFPQIKLFHGYLILNRYHSVPNMAKHSIHDLVLATSLTSFSNTLLILYSNPSTLPTDIPGTHQLLELTSGSSLFPLPGCSSHGLLSLHGGRSLLTCQFI